jgi:hypothetical protein
MIVLLLEFFEELIDAPQTDFAARQQVFVQVGRAAVQQWTVDPVGHAIMGLVQM